MAANDRSSTVSTANETGDTCETGEVGEAGETVSLGEYADHLPAVRHSRMLRASRSSDPTVLSSCRPSTGDRSPGQGRAEKDIDTIDEEKSVGGGGAEQLAKDPGEKEGEEEGKDDDGDDDKDLSLRSVNSMGNISIKEMATGRLLVTIGVLSLALFIAAIDQTIVATATVKISEEFDALSLAPWLANAYLLSSTALQPSTGKLSDILGRTPMLLAGIAVFAVGSLVCALAQSMAVLLVGRAIAGVGSAAIIGLTLVIVSDIVPMRKRGPYMAVFSLVFSASSVIGPLLGGVFADNISWRWIFWLSEPICGFVVVAIVVLLRRRLPARAATGTWGRVRRIDWLGIVLLVGGLVTLLMGLTLPSMGSPWRSARVVLCLVFGCATIAVFFLVEWRVAGDPVVPLRLFRRRNVAAMMAASFFMGACLFTPIYYIPIYYNVVENTSSTVAGIYLLPFVIGIMLTSIASGFLVMRLGVYRPFMWAGTAVCTLGLGLLGLLDRGSPMAARICYLLIAGLGVGSFIQLSLIAGQAAVEPSDMAATTSVLTFFRSIGSVFGMAVMQTIMNSSLRQAIRPIELQFRLHAFTIGAALDKPSIIYSPLIPEAVRSAVIGAYMHSLHLVFLAMIPFGALMFVSTLFLEHRPLARRLPPAAVAE
ncbi:hypothetical protein LPJ53_003646 [Coemansia erecta]|uniref:Major facilitator superfamily (MFS) profile domain-containing protein n=1 Tax=Coemansia erecta TaxID=147472 RepID=A0A9W7XYT4_9FUNG|nr:hypothetical protein LPJ53_003646 [Coemansia erecta]